MPDGVTEIGGETGEIILYPNPNNGVFRISMENEESGACTVRIINNQGQAVFIKEFNARDLMNEPINVQDLPRGIYVILIQTDNGIYQRKMVIQ